MEKKITISGIGLSIVIGLTVLGIFINKGLQSFSNKERVVMVRGLAEKRFKATSATMTISLNFSGDFPKELTTKIEKNTADIASYLNTIGYENAVQSELDIYDSKSYYEYEWNDDGKRVQVKKDRYRVSKTLSFNIKEVEQAKTLENKINRDLIEKDLSSNVRHIVTNYHFAELNDIKPELIAESTQNARTAGEQFAKDSKSRLGKIKTASQGQIELSYNDFNQTARVVSTIVFYLED